MPSTSSPTRRGSTPPNHPLGSPPTGEEPEGAAAPRPRESFLPLAGVAILFALLAVTLHLSSRLRDTLESQLVGRLRLSAELAADALSRREAPEDGPLDGEWTAHLEEIRRATSVSAIYLYDRSGSLLGGASPGGVPPAVPRRIRLAGEGAPAGADPLLRSPEKDAAGGRILLVPLGESSGAGALLTRIDRGGQGGLPAIDLLFLVAKALAGVVIAVGVLILFRWVGRASPAESVGSPATASSDVDVVLGTMKEVMTTLKVSETAYRDRWTAAEADAEHYRRTNDLILESMTSGMVAFDSAGRITLFNRAAEKILGIHAPAVPGRTVEEVFGEDDPVCRLATDLRLRGRVASRSETARPGPDGEIRWLGISSSVLRRGDGEAAGGILLLADLTETKRLREQMGLKDRLSAVGEMSAGIAHEIKNSLHSLMGFANLLREDFADREVPLAVQGILSEVRSLEAIVRGILEFSKPSRPVKAEVAVNELCRGVRDSTREAAERAGVEIVLDLEEGLPRVCLDAEEVQRAFRNLALNAVEAMEGGGTLTITTRSAESPGEEGDEAAPAVRIAFRDTGRGIPEADRARIFTPFYSTKRWGSGLGLALCHKTITDHGGRLYLHSRVGVGTEFVIHLPAEG